MAIEYNEVSKIAEIIKYCSCYIDDEDNIIISSERQLEILKNILIGLPNDIRIDIIFPTEDEIVMILYKRIGNRYIKFAVEIFSYKIMLDIYEVKSNDIILIDGFECSTSQEILDVLKSE